jgi:hypothetical protein
MDKQNLPAPWTAEEIIAALRKEAFPSTIRSTCDISLFDTILLERMNEGIYNNQSTPAAHEYLSSALTRRPYERPHENPEKSTDV